MDGTVPQFGKLRINERSHRTSVPESLATSAEGSSRDEKPGSDADVLGQSLFPSDHLPFHGSPLDRSGSAEWEQGRLPGVIKSHKSTEFLPVSGRSVYGVKQVDSMGKVQTFILHWLRSDDFRQNKNRLFPDATTHLLGKNGEAGWRFVVSLGTDAHATLLQLRKLKADLCAVDVRELTLIASQRDLAVAGHAVAISRWHQAHQFCPQCGCPSVPAVLGTTRRCSMDVGHPVLRPRVSVVAVALLQAPDGQHVLLARTRSMRPHMLNCMSVRIEVCEGVAEAVRRAVWRLLRLKVSDVSVQGSQPWVAGLASESELLLGTLATVESRDVVHEASEIEEAHWFSKQQLQVLLKGSAVPGHPIQTGFMAVGSEFFLPPPVTISHALLKYWVERP